MTILVRNIKTTISFLQIETLQQFAIHPLTFLKFFKKDYLTILFKKCMNILNTMTVYVVDLVLTFSRG